RISMRRYQRFVRNCNAGTRNLTFLKDWSNFLVFTVKGEALKGGFFKVKGRKGVGEYMAQIEYATSSYKTPMHHRILAHMPVQATWVDEESGKRIKVEGTTENLGENSALVNLETLPPV